MLKLLPKLTERELKRFWSHIDVRGPNDCWPYVRTNPKATGRTRIYLQGSGYRPHRVAYYLHHNVDPAAHPVEHNCNNLNCCNPNHMYLNSPHRNFTPMPELTQANVARFWSYVRKLGDNDCWLWVGYIQSDGYGKFKCGRKTKLNAHRVSYFLYTGSDPKELLVCHTCDTPVCVNPMHLWLGTDEDNSMDRDAKSRAYIGSRYGNAKLTKDQVLEIRIRLTTGEELVSIARDYGVGGPAIGNIRDDVTWIHV